MLVKCWIRTSTFSSLWPTFFVITNLPPERIVPHQFARTDSFNSHRTLWICICACSCRSYTRRLTEAVAFIMIDDNFQSSWRQSSLLFHKFPYWNVGVSFFKNRIYTNPFSNLWFWNKVQKLKRRRCLVQNISLQLLILNRKRASQ